MWSGLFAPGRRSLIRRGGGANFGGAEGGETQDMPETIQRVADAPRLMQHPLAATFLAIAWATLLVAFVAGISGHFGGAAFAHESGAEGAQQSPAGAP